MALCFLYSSFKAFTAEEIYRKCFSVPIFVCSCSCASVAPDLLSSVNLLVMEPNTSDIRSLNLSPEAVSMAFDVDWMSCSASAAMCVPRQFRATCK